MGVSGSGPAKLDKGRCDIWHCRSCVFRLIFGKLTDFYQFPNKINLVCFLVCQSREISRGEFFRFF